MMLPIPLEAGEFQFTSYYPIPSGNYQRIRLVPQPALPAINCQIGTIYANSSDNDLPYFCFSDGAGGSRFMPLSGPWSLNSNDLYLTDTSTPEDKKVGIGTTSPVFKLTVANDGGILSDGLASASSDLPVSGAGTRLVWHPKKSAFRAGGVSGDQWDDANIGTNSMAAGYNNVAQQAGSSVWGGENNSAIDGVSPWGAVITGGKNNTTANELSQILGGLGNTAYISARVFGKNNVAGNYSMTGGGENNNCEGPYSVIAGGLNNSTRKNADTVSGGSDNRIITGGESTISGGKNNVINIPE